jgi:hypothetical protein
MIEIGKVLKRAWHILLNYRILWIFGILLAITAGGSNLESSSSYRLASGTNNAPPANISQYGPWGQEFSSWAEQNLSPLFTHPAEQVSTWIWIGAGILLFILICIAINAIIRYPSETAALRMVNEYEQTGTKVGFKQGWKLGWSRAAFRIWLVDLIISLPIILLVLVILGLGIWLFFSLTTGNGFNGLATGEIAMIAVIGFAFLLLFLFTILMVFLKLLRQFFVRKTALENTGVGDSFRQGWQMFKGNWKSAALMWLVMLGVGFGYGIVSFILLILMIPVFIILVIPSLIVGAIPGLLALGISSIFASGPLIWIIALLAAAPFFIMALGSPLMLVGGWVKIFESSVWTLAYREMKVLEGIGPTEVPVPVK